MAEKLMIQSIVTDNRITAQFSDKYLPRYARHGELFVVDGILYIYADLDNSNHGRWFPLTDEKEIFTFEQPEANAVWTIPIDFHTDNIQIIVYDDEDKIFREDFTVDVDQMQVQIVFEKPVAGQVYIVINKAFDWVDRRFIVADRNFAVTEDENNPQDYFLEIDTNYIEVLKNGNTTFRSDLNVGGSLNVTGATTFTGDQTLGGNVDIGGDLSIGGTITIVNKLIADFDAEIKGNLQVDGNATIDGDLIVKGTTTTIQTEEIKLDDNIVTLNANAVGTPSQNAGIEVQRGDEGVTTIIQWDETNDVTNIPNNTTINGDLQVDGATNIDGDLTIQGENVNINTSTLTVEDNVITINKGLVGAPTEDAGLEIDRGDEGVLPLVTFNETTDKVTIPVKQQNGSFLQDEVAGKVYTLDEINKEKARAIGAETILTNNLTAEVTRATTTETDLQLQITNEKTARVAGDNTLETNLNNEVARATNAEDTLRSDLNTESSSRETSNTNLQTQITNEGNLRTNADAVLQSSINTEKARAEGIEVDLQTQITTESTRATTVEGDLLTLTTTDKTNLVNAINEEIARATTNEAGIASDLLTETNSRTTSDAAIQTSLDNEVTRATTAEGGLQTSINNEVTNRIAGDATVQASIDSEVTRATTAEAAIDAKFAGYIGNTILTPQALNSDLTVNESVVIKKDLTVEGTTTTVNSTTTEVDDNKIILNSSVTTGIPALDASVLIRRGDAGEQPIIKWYENGNDSEVQISEWDTTTTQFVNKAVATQNYVNSELATVNTSLDTRISTLENDTSVSTLTNDLNNEVIRATATEGDLTSLTTTVTTNLVAAINSEVSRATGAESTLTTNLNSEVTRAVAQDNQIIADLDSEITTRTTETSTLTTNLANEITRATTVEGDISTLTTVNKLNLTSAINSLKTEVDSNATATASSIDSMFTQSGNDIIFKGNLIPESDSLLNIGSTTKKIGELHVSANTIYLGDNTVISELGLQMNGSLSATNLNATSVTADNIYDKTTVDTKVSGVETELTRAINTLEAAHNDLVDTVSTDSLSKSVTTPQSVTSDVTFASSLNVQGNLNVVGTQTTTDVVTLAIENNEVILNDGTTGAPYLDASVSVDRGTLGIQPILTWNELGVNSSVMVPYINANGEIIQDEVVTADTLSATITATNDGVSSALTNEVTRATTTESNLQTQINDEVTRAKGVEGVMSGLSSKLQDNLGNLPTTLVSALNKEVTRASTTESNLETSITNETTRATQSEVNLQSSIDGEIARASTKETAIESALNTEVLRATTAESTLSSAITTEKTRAIAKENQIASDLSVEVIRAVGVESGLQSQIDSISLTMSSDAERLAAIQSVTTAFETADGNLNNAITNLSNTATTNLDAEIARATSSENTISSNLTSEITRAKDVEGQLIALDTVSQLNLVSAINEVHTDVDTEKARAEASEGVIQSNLDTETNNRTIADNTLTTNLNSEISRASQAEATLTTDLGSEETARISADSLLTTNLANEIVRATTAEQANTSAIAAEEARATTAESTLTTNLNNEVTARTSADSSLQTAINTEKARIDSILSASTADKDSFAEIVTLINSVDTTNDTAFASYVTSNNTAVADRYTKAESDSRFINNTGDIMVGNLGFNTTGTGLDWSMNTDGASIKFFNTADGDTNSRLEFAVRDNGNEYFRWVNNDIEQMTLKGGDLNVAGAITASNDVTAFSDVRIKDNVENITEAVSKVQQINGITYTRNDIEDTETRFTGVIAQEVEAVLPEAVQDNENGMKSVAYGNMVGLLIEAVKEQQTQIEELKTEINKLKGN